MEILDDFVVLEGLDGAGTTTQLARVAEACKAQGRPCVTDAEPTSGPVGSLVRAVLQGKYTMQGWTLALLYAADRNEHVARIRQWCAEGNLVVCDRYFFSTIAYQGVVCDVRDLWNINRTFPFPSQVLYIDTPVEECLRRIEHRGQKKELFERRDYLTKVRENYETAFRLMPEGSRLTRIDGTLPIDAVEAKVKQALGLNG